MLKLQEKNLNDSYKTVLGHKFIKKYIHMEFVHKIKKITITQPYVKSMRVGKFLKILHDFDKRHKNCDNMWVKFAVNFTQFVIFYFV